MVKKPGIYGGGFGSIDKQWLIRWGKKFYSEYTSAPVSAFHATYYANPAVAERKIERNGLIDAKVVHADDLT